MGSQQKDIELGHVKLENRSKKPEEFQENDEEDVIIGRFRKISSAKSMAATNGNIQYPTDIPKPDIDSEIGLEFRARGGEKLVREEVSQAPACEKSSITKSSFRDVEKPSRFKDQPSATRFQMQEETQQDEGTESDGSGMESDDPLTAADTKYGKSFRHFTREALPRLDNYRNVLSLHAAPRPTLDELHNASLSRKVRACSVHFFTIYGSTIHSQSQTLEKDMDSTAMASTNVKFGWIKGVLMRCMLNIWGVMLFLRLSWMVGQAGVGQAILLILTTSVVTMITALSMSAISTNGVIKGAIYGCITIILLTGIVVVGMEWEAKAQIVLLVILLAAIADFCIGAAIGPTSDDEIAQGYFEGVHHDFFSVFSIFFPAATGILAGANISGDLKVMHLVSAWGPLIYGGCFAAALSSALASLVSAPKVFQIAPLISNFFLAAYALINFATFHASLARPVGWRPTFRAQTYKTALSGVHHLNRVTEHVKNYRPQILVLTGFPGERPLLTDFTYLLTKGLSLMLCGHVVQSQINHRTREALTNRANHWFMKRKVKSFYSVVDGVDVKDGANALIQQIFPLNFIFPTYHVFAPSKALDVHMAIAVLRAEGGLYASDALDDDLQSCLHDMNQKDASVVSRSMGDNLAESQSTESLNAHSRGSSLSDLSLGSPAHVARDPAHKQNGKEKCKESMASLLSKFRIDYSALTMIPDITKKPKDSTLAYFDKLVAPFKTNDSNDQVGIKENGRQLLRQRLSLENNNPFQQKGRMS
ncbi:unnamed protein product [Leptidea sinapis]|uniref:Amino acid permease/ SLC12A domain-containing protein n=1 Tax=Leptidea sinapis TaxID=189913 RepID=A0A5E4QMA4_9NEOP|nr:unnamed protein product [Leptidea sinapis]